MSAIQSTVIGAVRSLEEAEGDFAKGIGAMKVANSAVADGKLAVKAISAPGAAATEFISRFTSINLSVSSITSQMEHYENLPTHIKTSWFHFDDKIWNHDGGAKLEATSVFVPNAETITMRSGIHRTVSNAVSDSASVGFNPLAPQASGVIKQLPLRKTFTIMQQSLLIMCLFDQRTCWSQVQRSGHVSLTSWLTMIWS